MVNVQVAGLGPSLLGGAVAIPARAPPRIEINGLRPQGLGQWATGEGAWLCLRPEVCVLEDLGGEAKQGALAQVEPLLLGVDMALFTYQS